MTLTPNRGCMMCCAPLMILIWGSLSPVCGQTRSNRELVETIDSFLTKWLVKRDVGAAMLFVSDTPTLGACNLSPELVGKKTLSPSDQRTGIRLLLQGAIADLPRTEALASIIEPTGTPPPGELAIMLGQSYDLFHLRDNRSSRFICKFDSSRAFRKKFERSDVWYATFQLKRPLQKATGVIVAWARERNKWRMISVGPLEE